MTDTDRIAALEADVRTVKLRLDALEHPNTTPTPTPEPLRITSKTVIGDTATLTWTTDPNKTVDTFTVDRNGTDTNGTGPWHEIVDDYTYTFRNLRPLTTYMLGVEVLYTDGTEDRTTADITTPPEPTPATPPPTTGRRIPLAGKSGLGYNSILFQGGTADLPRLQAFGTRRGNVPMDGGLTFVPRDSWESLANPEYLKAARKIIDDGGLVVFSIPHAPESEGDQMNSRGAASNLYATSQKALGKTYAAAGLNNNRFVIRLNWEFNGSWYPWSANRGGGPANLKASIRNAVANLRAGGITNARFSLSVNGDKSQSGADLKDVFPGSAYIDNVGIDVYDHWYPTRTQAEWDAKAKRTEGIQTVIDFARANGVTWSVDEAGNAHGDNPKNFGGDNPAFYRFLYATVRANARDCGWVTTYDHEGSPNTLMHDFARNPLSWAEYLKQMKIKAWA
jgi:fibronectin type III domain protein/glycosyl hydrolase family 26